MNAWGKKESDDGNVGSGQPVAKVESSGPGSSGVGRVKAVLSGDSFVVWVQRPGGESFHVFLFLLPVP